jgi:hypothetical protein
MSDHEGTEQIAPGAPDIRNMIRQVLDEFVRVEQQKAEPAYKAELHDERKRREALEQRVNELAEENRRARAAAEEAERNSQIRSELQRLGVAKVDLAFRAVKDDIVRGEDGKLQSRSDARPLQEFLAHFVQENPELLPARIAGGSGVHANARKGVTNESSVSLDQIRPGMDKDALERARQEISRLAMQALRGA